MRWVRGLAIGLAVVAAAVAAAWGVGTRLPREHRATVSRDLGVPASTVWRAIVDLEGSANWRRGVESVVRLPDRDGKPAYRQEGSFGPMTFVVEEMEPPRRLVVRVVDDPDFGGTWTYEVGVSSSGTTLAITEDGEIADPFFRFVARFVLGYEGTIEDYLEDLAAELRAG